MSTSRFAERFGPRGNDTHALMSLELQYVVRKNKHDLLLTARAEASRGGDAPQHTLHMAEDLRVCARWSEYASATEFADATCIFDATHDAMRLAVHSATPVRRSLERVCWAQALLQHVNNYADDVRAVFVTRVQLAKREAASRRRVQLAKRAAASRRYRARKKTARLVKRAAASRRCHARKKTAAVTCQQCARKSAIAATCRQCERPSLRVRHTCLHTRALRTRGARKSATAATCRQRTRPSLRVRHTCLRTRVPLRTSTHQPSLLLQSVHDVVAVTKQLVSNVEKRAISHY